MADFPVLLTPALAAQLAGAFDTEGKIPRAFQALGATPGADVVVVDGDLRSRQLADLGAHVTSVASNALAALPDESADALVSCWSLFRDDQVADLAVAARLLRPGGRVLVLHDYGRDDVSRMRSPDLPEYSTWGRRDGWFLRTGFKVRVIHCWWTFPTLAAAVAFVDEAFGAAGRALSEGLTRPRLSYNVAMYHWTKDGGPVA